ncbi:MAG: hypothetical protein J0M29_21580 [Chitinophagales bacterium]|nr:hypothetical protein [Chitinophagales bacterium]
MFFVFLGIIAIVIGASVAKANPNLTSFGKVTRYIGLFFILVGLSTACFVQIQPGEVGVQTLFGQIQSGTLTEGLNMVNPW